MLQQIICTIKIRRAPTRQDNIDFRPLITRTSNILPLSVVTGDKGYDSEENHLLVREHLHAFSIIPARYEHVSISRTHGKYGKYRKEMKLELHGYMDTVKWNWNIARLQICSNKTISLLPVTCSNSNQ